MSDPGPEVLRCARCQGPLASASLSGRCPRCLAAGLARLESGEERERDRDPGRVGGEEGDPAGWRLGPYEVLAEVGRGAMGIVYRARHVELDRDVALKVLRDPGMASMTEVDRFRFEALSAARLSHPNVVRVHDSGEVDGRPYLAMEFIAGRTLAGLVREGPLAARHAADLLRKVADAVGHAHGRGVLHRDLKPSNVLVDARGEPHVTDFGLAKSWGAGGGVERERDLTLTGQVLGTPAYMAPEQAAGDAGRGRVGPATDVHALGALLHHLLTGQPPFLGESVAEVLRRVVEETPASPTLVRPGLPRDLVTICRKCLRKEPEARYPTARELAEDLRRFLSGEPILARPAGWVERLVKWGGRNRALAGALGLAGVALLAGLSTTTWQWLKARGAMADRQERLWEAQGLQARGLRLAGEPGQRLEALKVLADAAAFRPSRALRNEAAAVLSRIDLRERPEVFLADPRPDDLMRLPHMAVSPVDGTVARFRSRAGGGGAVIEVVEMSGERPPVSLDLDGQSGRELVFSADGRLLAARYYGGDRVVVWDWRAGRAVWSTPAPSESYFALEFSGDGRFLAVCGQGGFVLLLDAARGEELRRLELPDFGPQTRARFSPDSSRLAVVGSRTLTVWEVGSGRRVGEEPFPMALGSAMAWHPDGERVAVVPWRLSEIHVARFGHRFARGGDGAEREPEPEPEAAPAPAPARANSIRVWRDEGGGSFLVEFHPAGELLVSRGVDGFTRLWDVASEQIVLKTHLGAAVGFRSDGGVLYFERETESIGAWDLVTNRVHRAWRTPEVSEDAGGPVFDGTGRRLAWVAAGAAWVTDVGVGEPVRTWGGRVEGIRFDPGDGTLIHAAGDGLARWRSGGVGMEGEVEAGEWVALDQTPDGRVLVLGSRNGVELRRGGGATVRWAVGPEVYSVAISPDARWLAVGTHENEGLILDAESGQVVSRFPGHRASAVFDPVGRWLMLGSRSEYRLRSVGDWVDLREWRREGASVWRSPMAVQPGGGLVALMATPRTIVLADPADGREVIRLEAPVRLFVTGLAFDPGGRRLVATSERGVVQMWDLGVLRAELSELGLDWVEPVRVPEGVGSGSGPRLGSGPRTGSAPGAVQGSGLR